MAFLCAIKIERMNKILSVIFAAVVVSFCGCEVDMISPLLKDEETKNDSVVLYTIPAGSHYSNQSAYRALNVSQIRFKARFDSSAVYQTVHKNNQGDINQLYGMSDCESDHQMNSARFGWRWVNNVLEIWAYSYVNSERKYVFVTTVPLNANITYGIIFSDTNYIFSANDTEVSLPRHCKGQAKGYKLYPYFGGDENAPHKITIEIEDL
jgi:hypothetical protein